MCLEEEKISKIAPLNLHPLGVQFAVYEQKQLLQGVCISIMYLQFYIHRNGTIHLYDRNFQKNKRAAVQAYGDDNPGNKILVQAIVVSTGNEGCFQYIGELEYSV